MAYTLKNIPQVHEYWLDSNTLARRINDLQVITIFLGGKKIIAHLKKKRKSKKQVEGNGSQDGRKENKKAHG